MPRPDGTPTIAEIIADCDEDRPPPLAVGNPVRFRAYGAQGTSWAYGTITKDLGDALFVVTRDDGSDITLNDDDLQCTTWPRDPDKPWPADQDCTHCPGQVGGQHKFGCAIGGAQQIRLSAVQDPDGKIRIV